MIQNSQTFGCITVTQLGIGFRFTRKGSPGLGQSREWTVTNLEQLEVMELRARATARPTSTDLLAAIRWAVEQNNERLTR